MELNPPNTVCLLNHFTTNRERIKMSILNNFTNKTDSTTDTSPALNLLKEDIAALKSNGTNFVHHVNENASNLSRDGMNKIMEKAENGLNTVESYIKSKPSQSIMIAFAAGLIANYFLSVRR